MTTGSTVAKLRNLLNQWDPIEVADFDDDEYDCLLAPLWQQLTGHPTRAQIRGYLWCELQDHFGLDPTRCAVDEIADRLVALAVSWNCQP